MKCADCNDGLVPRPRLRLRAIHLAATIADMPADTSSDERAAFACHSLLLMGELATRCEPCATSRIMRGIAAIAAAISLAGCVAGCFGGTLGDADSGPPPLDAAAAVGFGGGGRVGISVAAGASSSRPADAGTIDAPDAAAPPPLECLRDIDCTAPLPAPECPAPNSLREVTGWYCADGACRAATFNSWCGGGCSAGVCE